MLAGGCPANMQRFLRGGINAGILLIQPAYKKQNMTWNASSIHTLKLTLHCQNNFKKQNSKSFPKDVLFLQLAGPDRPQGCCPCWEQDCDCDPGTAGHGAHTHRRRSQPAGTLDVPGRVWQRNGPALPRLHERYHTAPCSAPLALTRRNTSKTLYL